MTTGEPMSFDPQVMWNAIPVLAEGLRYTLLIAIVGMGGGFVLGVFAGLARALKWRWLSRIALIYITIFRGTPLLVQAMFIYFALPLMTGLRFDALSAAIVALALNSGAYIAEIVRGAVISIDTGLFDAGAALGLKKRQILRLIVAPIAFHRMIPPLGNQFIIAIKDTSLFIVIGVSELTRQGQELVATTFRAMEIWLLVAIFYLILTSILAWGLQKIERRMRVY